MDRTGKGMLNLLMRHAVVKRMSSSVYPCSSQHAELLRRISDKRKIVEYGGGASLLDNIIGRASGFCGSALYIIRASCPRLSRMPLNKDNIMYIYSSSMKTMAEECGDNGMGHWLAGFIIIAFA